VSDITAFENLVASDSEHKIAKKAAVDKLDAAIYDVREQYGAHLFCAKTKEEFNDRVALCKDDMIKTVNTHLMPVTGVMRKVCKAMEREWRERTAGKSADPTGMEKSPTHMGRARRADKTGPVQDIDQTFSPSDDLLVPEGDFDRWLDSVDQGAPAKVDKNFRDAAGHRVKDFSGSGRTPTNPYTGDDGGKFNGDPQGRGHWADLADAVSEGDEPPLVGGKYQARRKHADDAPGTGSSSDVAVSPSGGSMPSAPGSGGLIGGAGGPLPDSTSTGLIGPAADGLGAVPSNQAYVASIIKRYAQWCVANLARPSFRTMDYYAAKRPDREYLILTAALQRHGSRRRTAGGGGKDYLQQADEAITNLLNEKAEEFQESIQPLQQALQTIQYAEQMQQAQNPMGVMPPAGTVNVLPQGQAPQGPPPQGVDPSGQVDPAMLAQIMQMAGGGGGQPQQGGLPPAAAQQGAIPPELAQQMQMQASRLSREEQLVYRNELRKLLAQQRKAGQGGGHPKG